MSMLRRIVWSSRVARRYVILVALLTAGLPASLQLEGGTVHAAPSTLYTITDLGNLGGGYAYGYGINNAGQVVGYSGTAAGASRAFVWQNGSMTDLGSLGGTDTEAYAINATGQVTGYSSASGTSNVPRHAFRWQNGTMTDLGTLAGTNESFGRAINSSGVVAGESDGYAATFANGSVSTVAPFAETARGINDNGHVAGYYYPPSLGPYGHAYLWNGSALTDLGALPGGNFSEAYAINSSDAVVGDARSSGTLYEAFLWQNGTMTGLGSLDPTDPSPASYAYALNNANPVQVVGSSTTPGSGGYDAFVWQNGVMTDLNSALMNGSGVTLTDARGINDSGQIVANGLSNGQPHAFLLTPTTPAPIVYLHPAQMTFGDADPGTSIGPYSLVIANHGNADLQLSSIAITGVNAADFSQTNTCGTAVPAGSACTVGLTFTPSAYGPRSASVVVTDNASDSPESVPLSGYGGTPAISVSPTALSFGNQRTGTASATQSVTVSNTGHADLTVYQISISGTNWSDFAQSSTCGSTVSAGASCTVSVSFTPAATGARSATLHVASSASIGTSDVTLSGTGVQPGASLSSTSLAFGSANTGTTSAAQTVTLTNPGTDTLNISSIAVTGTAQGDFSQTNGCPAQLPAGSSCSISVRFTPLATGSRGASLAVSDDAPGSPQAVALSGIGTAPAVSLSATTLNFGNAAYNTTTAPQSVTITNTGTGPLTFSSSGGFLVAGGNSAEFTVSSTTCGSTLATGASCSVSLTFTPLGAGNRSSTLYVRDDAPTSPQQVALSGYGLSADLGLTNTPSATTVKSGTAITYTLRTTNSGPNSATGVVVTDVLPAGETFNSASTGCSLSGSTVTCSVGSLASGASASVTVTVKVKTSSSSLVNTGNVRSTSLDPNNANNTASATITVR